MEIVTEVETKALSIVDRIEAIKIVDSASYESAGLLWKDIGSMIKEVKYTLDPICEASNLAHKKSTAFRASILDPLTNGQRQVKGWMSDYDAEQERIRKAEETRLAEMARLAEVARRTEELRILEVERKAEEARLLAAAIEADKCGLIEQADELLKAAENHNDETAQVAVEILLAPAYTPPIVLPKTTPKLTGGPVYQERWSAEVTDIKALCLAVADGTASPELVLANMPALNTLAVRLKNTMAIPGVRAISKRV